MTDISSQVTEILPFLTTSFTQNKTRNVKKLDESSSDEDEPQNNRNLELKDENNESEDDYEPGQTALTPIEKQKRTKPVIGAKR